MRDKINMALIFFGVLAIFYGTTAWVTWETNPANWSDLARIFSGILGIYCAVCLPILYKVGK